MKKEEYKLIYEFEQKYWWYRALHELVIKIIQQRFSSKSINILDAGCGTGQLISKLQPFGIIEGIDYSQEAIYYCKQRGLENVSSQDLNTWETTKQYDVIISLDVLYHAAIEDDLLIVEKFKANLTKNGMLILNLPAFPMLKRNHDIIVSTKRRYKLKPLIKELQQRGFKIELASYRVFPLFFIIFAQKIMEKVFNPKPTSDLKQLPNFINRILLFYNRIENFFILNIAKLHLGSSVFIVATKEN